MDSIGDDSSAGNGKHYWGGLFTVQPSEPVSSVYMQKYSSVPVGPFFWGAGHASGETKPFPNHSGNVEAGMLIRDGSVDGCSRVVDEALTALDRIFDSINHPDPDSRIGVVKLRLSSKMSEWKRKQQGQGRVLPAKGKGIQRASDKNIDLVNGQDWPPPLLTNNTLFGVGFTNLLNGAYDPQVLYSNYCVDMAFYYEHGFNRIFPEFEPLFEAASNDPHALGTFAGLERRDSARFGLRYIRRKVALEHKYLPYLSGLSAKFDRRTAQCIMFGESSLVGMAVEATTREHDVPAVMSELVFSSPGTDVIDVGSDIGNSEIMNSFLNTADITETARGVVSEDVLRTVFEAYSHTCGRMLTERWATPTAGMTSHLYVWHMCNDRHMFLRRAVLGYDKVRREGPTMREADMDEAFDENYHTTGFSRPLKNACDGSETCNQAAEIINGHERREMLQLLWGLLVTGPLAYARAGVVKPEREVELVRDLREALAQCWHDGLVHELSWLICHASFHSWQVNFLIEAAMWGSFLDDGTLAGKLDRADKV